MCGIVGQIENKGRVDLPRFLAMRARLRHRGPDGVGLYASPDGSAALGHTRLALVDLSDAGRQPMANEDRSLWLVVNGEIYNAPLLRRELADKGHLFSSRSDSEVILHGFEEWGEGVLSRLSGMFALAIWDENRRRLFLARDRFGIKPLYWAATPDRFVFASEVKALAVGGLLSLEVDFAAACDYFAYRYVPAPKTIWKGVHKLSPGHFLFVENGRPRTPKRWWTLPLGERRMPRAEAASRMNELLRASCAAHLQSDVPVGAFLSGGYDSSALALTMADLLYPVRAFSIGFSGWEKSEHKYARQVAAVVGADLKESILGPESLDILDELSWVYDEPLADISTVPTYEVSRLAAGNVKAVFSGEGADELFGGYTWHQAYHERHGRMSPFARAAGRLGFGPGRPGVPFYAESMAMGRFDRPELLRLLSPELASCVPMNTEWFYRDHYRPELAPVRSMQHLDFRCFMGEL
ncbi:MAG: asparagine synthase (glutamine-hydrolyzing), partial [Proteobacteria bacterium]|nr:asparagine synthase (glutamine-hydrolyzing) [Pseudomonadota bacterium]